MAGGVALDVRGVSKVYRRGRLEVVALREVSFRLEAGSALAIMGPSGAGKTTLLNILAGLDTPTRGEVWIAGERLDALDAEAATIFRRRHIGFVFQFFNLLPTLTAAENVGLPLLAERLSRREVTARAHAALAQVGLADRADHRPDELSGGEQQRVAMARAFVNRPMILLADEPTGNIDPATSIGIMKVLDRINRTGTTVVMATHDAAIVDSMRKRVIELEYGKVVRDQARGVYGQAY